MFYAVNREKKESCTCCARGNWDPRAAVAVRSAGEEVDGSAELLRVLMAPCSAFSYGWFNTAMVLEGRRYLPWLSNR